MELKELKDSTNKITYNIIDCNGQYFKILTISIDNLLLSFG